MVDHNRHAPSGKYRRLRSAQAHPAGLSQVYHGRARRSQGDVYERDHVGGGRFRWLLSTCLAGIVGLGAVGVVIIGSTDRAGKSDNMLERISQAQAPQPPAPRPARIEQGLNWAMPKSDRLKIATGTLTARYTIHEQVRTRKNNRPFIEIRPYTRIVARLAPTAARNSDLIPPFNPFQLYAATNENSAAGSFGNGDPKHGKVKLRVVELVGGILPGTDGQELDPGEINALVQKEHARISSSQQPDLAQAGRIPAGLTPQYLENTAPAPSQPESNLSIIYRNPPEAAPADDSADPAEVRVIRVADGDTLAGILRTASIQNWQIAEIEEQTQPAFPPEALRPGQEIHLRLARSLSSPDSMEPLSISIFDPGHVHRVTVKRNDSGEFSATTTLDQASLFRAILRDNATEKTANLYTAIYDAALTQKISPELILKIMRIHVYETDYRRRVQNGDQVEFFFELIPQTRGQPRLGELLYTSVSVGGNRTQYWRFRTRDGVVDFYDEKGRNAKKFLMRKPVRGSDVRFTSGYGYRFHPIHRRRKMHTGVDWAGPPGTPILAAGKGVIEHAGWRSGYGNYIRIRHANGYQTAYAHMRRLAPGMRSGVKVRQGQVIGYLGSTGLSSGPHLHYEVLVNNQFVDPLKIKVPRARTLTGDELANFKSEMTRISALMRRPPVKTHTQ